MPLLRITILIGIILLISCGDNPIDNCEDTLQRLTNASSAFSEKVTTSTCEEYKNAWLTHVEDCTPVSNTIQEEVENLECQCYDLYNTMAEAADAYSNNPVPSTCNAYKEAIENVMASSSCDTDGSFTALLDNLDC